MKTGNFIFLVMIFLSGCSTFRPTVVATNTPEETLRQFPEIADVNRYSEVLNSANEDSPLIAHFPKEISSEASNVKFLYRPRVMQGAMILELLMTLPENQIDEVWNKYGSLEQYQFTEDKTITDIPEPILYLIRDENYEIDQNFSIYLISAEPAGNEDFIWNHGTMYGVGINETTFQIIYWLEYW